VRQGRPQQELAIAATSGRFEDESWRLRKDGSRFWASIVITALRDAEGRLLGFSKITRDQTKHKLAEEMFRAVVETTADAIVVTDSRGKIALVNAQTEKLVGYRRVELMGQDVNMLIPVRFRGEHPQYWAELAGHPPPQSAGGAMELSATRKDGSEVSVEISLGPFGTDDGVYMTAVIRDITDRKCLEAEVEANRMRMTASARLSALGLMAGGIAHEINNPLSVIHGLASDLTELAEQGDVAPGEIAESTRRIEQYAERVAKIVKSLLHIAHDGAKDPFAPTPIGNVVAQALDLCKERFRTHSVDLRIAPIDPGICIECREGQISQILINLLQNSFDAVQEHAGEKWVCLEVAVHDNIATLSVTDSGDGVPPELKSRIMEPFFTTKPVGKGTGLGLSLSKRIAEEHGGTLEMGERGGHTCFSLLLPISG
jgi:PAS domain S-box-containing protein